MKNKTLEAYPILLAGGSGTRLWPVSRSLFPKQLVSFGDKRSLIQETILRLSPVFDLNNVNIVCGREHLQETARQLRDIGLKARDNIFGEPVGRNTAPAILLATEMVLRKISDMDAVLFIFPADHVVKHVGRFQEKIREAERLADSGHIVTFGIEPDFPETGYGYIEAAEPVPGGALTIRQFVEKPDRKTAAKYVQAGNYFWNSGMFAFKASVILEEYERLVPDMCRKMKRILERTDPLSAERYRALSNISFDYAIMEHTSKGVVLPSDFGWSDIGSWKSLYEFLMKDAHGNVIRGDVIASQTQQSLIMANSRLIVTHDLKHTVIVETPDAVFVSSMENSRDVKDVVASLKKRERKEYQSHTTEWYGWGSLKHVEEASDFHIVELDIRAHETYRDTIDAPYNWHIFLIKGEARLSHGTQEKILNAGKSCMVYGPDQIALENNSDQTVSAVRIQIKKQGGTA